MSAPNPTAYRPSAGKRAGAWLVNRFAIIAAVLVLFYLFLPVLYVTCFGRRTAPAAA